MSYKRALPDIDISFVKFVAKKTFGFVKPIVAGFFNGLVGVIVALAIVAVGWMLTVGLYRIGWYVGCYLGVFNVSRANDDNYLWWIWPGPWFVGVLPFIALVISHKLGSYITRSIKKGRWD